VAFPARRDGKAGGVNQDRIMWISSQEDEEFLREVEWRIAYWTAKMKSNPLLAYLAQLGDA